MSLARSVRFGYIICIIKFQSQCQPVKAHRHVQHDHSWREKKNRRQRKPRALRSFLGFCRPRKKRERTKTINRRSFDRLIGWRLATAVFSCHPPSPQPPPVRLNRQPSPLEHMFFAAISYLPAQMTPQLVGRLFSFGAQSKYQIFDY